MFSYTHNAVVILSSALTTISTTEHAGTSHTTAKPRTPTTHHARSGNWSHTNKKHSKTILNLATNISTRTATKTQDRERKTHTYLRCYTFAGLRYTGHTRPCLFPASPHQPPSSLAPKEFIGNLSIILVPSSPLSHPLPSFPPKFYRQSPFSLFPPHLSHTPPLSLPCFPLSPELPFLITLTPLPFIM